MVKTNGKARARAKAYFRVPFQPRRFLVVRGHAFGSIVDWKSTASKIARESSMNRPLPLFDPFMDEDCAEYANQPVRLLKA